MGQEAFQAVDVRQEDEELRRLPDVFLLPRKPGHLRPQAGVGDAEGAVELGAGVGGGPLQGEEEPFQIPFRDGLGLEVPHAPALGEHVQEGFAKGGSFHAPHYSPSQAR